MNILNNRQIEQSQSSPRGGSFLPSGHSSFLKKVIFHGKQAISASLILNDVMLVHNLQIFVGKDCSTGIPGVNPRMEGETKDGRHPRFERPVLFLLDLP